MLYLVRHGRTAANAAGLLLGRLDPELDAVGRWQAARLGEALGSLDRVVSSPLTRTRQTAAYLDGEVEVDDRFVEVDYGELDGVPVRDVPKDVWVAWRGDVMFAPPGGETFAHVFERVSIAMVELTAALREPGAGRDVAVVSHVLPIKAALGWALGTGVEVAWHLHLDQASITRIAVGADGPVVHTYNDTSHLAGGPPAP